MLVLLFIIGTAQNIIENVDIFVIRFPTKLYVSTLFLVNFIYVIGNSLEAVYNMLWEKKMKVIDFEKKFFKASLIMTLVINGAGILIYLINKGSNGH